MGKKTLVPILAKNNSHDVFPAGDEDGALKIRFIGQNQTDATALMVVAAGHPNGKRVDRTRCAGGRNQSGRIPAFNEYTTLAPRQSN